ncbi:hypothetical protein BH20ACT17_BH20ACT17_06340 [soil metagenome]
MSGAAERTLVIEARDLDTDERTVATFEVEMPVDEAGREAQLAEMVARLHPDARMRSFGGAAASFLDSERLVVAHYDGPGRQPTQEGTADRIEPIEQQPLFAA